MKRKSRSAVLIGVPLAVFLLAFAGALYYVFLPDYLEHNRILNHGSRVTGRITKVYPFRSSDTEFYTSITYTFAPHNGLLLTNAYDISWTSIPEIGEPVEIAYDPAKPTVNFPVRYYSPLGGHIILWVFEAWGAGFAAAMISLGLIKLISRWDF